MEGAEETARFMTITFDCTEKMKQQSPAVCHVDGTARPQLIRKKDNPSYYKILTEYHRISGIPSLVNTSFNIHEEPIVNTAKEAIQAFRASGLDALMLGDKLILAAPAVQAVDSNWQESDATADNQHRRSWGNQPGQRAG